MTVDQLIIKLQALSPETRSLPVVTYSPDGYYELFDDMQFNPFELGTTRVNGEIGEQVWSPTIDPKFDQQVYFTNPFDHNQVVRGRDMYDNKVVVAI